MVHTVVIAPDSFKGTIGAAHAAAALGDGWHRVRPHDIVRLLPMADGGEGTLDAFATALPGARRMPITVTGPAGTPVEASWLLLPPTATDPGGIGVVELASTSGIELLGTPPRLRPLDAGTRGFGEAIAAALAHGVSRLVLGIGSSASTDGGTGMLTALGARFTDAAGHPIAHGGRGVTVVAAADLSGLPPLPPRGVTVLSDVTNPLLGAWGAAAVFGPQKGAAPGDVLALDGGLSRLAALLPADPDVPGAGAAGGTGFGLLAWGATLVPGSAAVAELVGLGAAVAEASVVVTGEGSYDGQSAAGKVPAHVGAVAASAGVGVALVAGRITGDADVSGFAATASLTELAGSGAAAMGEPARWLAEAGATLARALG
ncbi:glycerate kinase [Microbacterium sp. CFBP9034]|uniref:glycerate kinase n=1 Tax=Microbacterium sp. CFBP9034 TaxID=3096540 RepID=UPI002A6A4352|nr:glycerate kinase [Microbacterium sp. CFBP9034]MDY0908434.1 glycerate kinase [Microbacterium sp. CFBP9034]